MKCIKTFTNSFVLQELDENNKVISELGFKKGGLTYLIKNSNVKFYLVDDYMYKNLVWSTNAPLMINGVSYPIELIPQALKSIFEEKLEPVEVDQQLDSGSTNAIANSPVAIAINNLETELEGKADIEDIPTNVSELVNDSGYITDDGLGDLIESAISGKADTSGLSEVAFSGDYDDLLNKPTIPTVPTDVSAFNNDAGYITEDALSGKVGNDVFTAYTASTATEISNKLDASAYTPVDLSSYYTKSETDNEISAATNDMATKTWVGEQGYLTEHQDISGKQDVSGMTAYTENTAFTAHTANTNIHFTTAAVETLITEAVSGKADIGDIPSVSGYADSVKYNSTTKYVEFYHGGTGGAKVFEYDASPFIIDGMVENVEIKTLSGASYLVVSFNTDAGKQDINIPISDIFDADNYYTKDATDDAISAATNDMATKTWVGEQGYLTEHQDISGKQDVSGMTAYTENAAFTTHTANTNIHVTSEEKSTWNSKSDFSGSYNDLTDKPTIPTVPTSNTAFTNDAGYITEDALSGYAESSAVTEEITAAVSGKADSSSLATVATSGDYDDLLNKPTIPTVPTDVSAFVNDAGYATSGYVDSQISAKTDTTAFTAHTANTTIHVTAGDKLYWDGKQDELVSGTNIKTINNESILGSGNITISGGSGSGNSVVECTQAEYDSMASGGTVDPTVFYIITDAPEVDLNNYYTKSQTNSAINAAVSGKVETSAITTSISSASTDSQVPSAKAVYDAIPTGGTGASYSAGTNISIANDTINCTLPLRVGLGYNGIYGGDLNNNSCYAQYGFAYGDNANCGNGGSYCMAFGSDVYANSLFAFITGKGNTGTNKSQAAFGQYTVNNKTNDTFGDSGNTLFSVGNGTAGNARHNAFEIRQNGDIYISKDGQDVKLQDQLGGGAASSAITSGDTNAVAGGAVYDKFDEVEQVTAAALNALNDNFGGLKLVRLTQQEYDNLSVKDSQTLYIIADVPFAGKWLATYTGGTTDSASCDSTSAITGNEITLTDLENLVIGDCVESIDFWAFDGATSLTSVTISDSVTSIGNCAFQNCNGLTDVTIGSGVTSIGGGAFNSTNGLFTLTIHATTPPTLTNDIFSEANGGIFVPAEAVQDYQNANIWSNYAQGIQPIQ